MYRRLNRHLGALVLASTLVLAPACAGVADSTSPPSASSTPPPLAAGESQRVTVTVANAMSFEPSALVVRAGQPVEVTLRNTGDLAHDFVLGEGASQPVRIVANAGQAASGAFTIAKPGTYTFVCSVPGHAAAGMRGTIRAE